MMWFGLLSLFLSIPFCFAEIEADGDGVLLLGVDNFEAALQAHDSLLVEFYAPWCGHCKTLAPEFAKAAKVLGKLSPPVFIGKVDATVERELAEEFGVSGYPSLKYFKNGLPTDYNGGRTEADIVSFMKKKSGPTYSILTTAAELANFKQDHEVFIAGHFSSIESDEAKEFIASASGSEEGVYALVSGDAATEIGASPRIAIFRQFDEPRIDYQNAHSATSDSISVFLAAHSLPLIVTFSQEKSKKIFGSGIDVHLLIFTDTRKEHHDAIRTQVRAIASDFKSEIMFVNVQENEPKIGDYFGLKVADYPKIILVNMNEGGMKKFFFPSTDPVTSGNLAGFIQAFKDGKLTPQLKSEEVTAEDVAHPVKVLKGKSFDEIVLNNDKDVLVEFYAPWCGHCKHLAPIWDDLAGKFKHVDSVVIAKIDATANEVNIEGVNVRGYPTIFFFKGGKSGAAKKAQLYSGGRELDDLVAFLKKSTATSFELDEEEEEEEEGQDEL